MSASDGLPKNKLPLIMPAYLSIFGVAESKYEMLAIPLFSFFPLHLCAFAPLRETIHILNQQRRIF